MSIVGGHQATSSDHEPLSLIQAEWPAPDQVEAWASTRLGGVSTGAYGGLNLGLNSGDDIQRVTRNRHLIATHFGAEPLWLQQVHGTDVVYGPALQQDTQQAVRPPQADASWTNQAGQLLAVLTADCLPLLFCQRQGDWVAVAHAGWRGLAAGVIARLLHCLPGPRDQVMVWLGPAISGAAYQVGPEVYQAFMNLDSAYASAFTRQTTALGERWLADIYAIARYQLMQLGVIAVYGGEYCTLRQEELFFSYRRDPHCGRQACFIRLRG